ncbi:AAA family ATPase [Candidatus Berkiella aquae]|uniref:AAA family ATPase n=1 Tax=Candidatus Berkiella aquae TaxID=295108 RepID=A0A0Q9YI76_9GAMM|nr:AAA family ATPase [Candidatus Berkiella aquae]MCS5712782.1 AAA family ATPase [Candidatus Berkiella aquae]
MLQEVKYVQNIGRFAQAKPVAHAVFGKCTLIFGENAWGKSTLADILRSLTTWNSEIIIGRKTLAGGPEQKAILQINGQAVSFNGDSWTGIKPKIAIYDSTFINDNVFSGDIVTNEHLKKQYGLVVGSEGVKLVRQIVDLDNENNDINKIIRNAEDELKAVSRSILAPYTISVDDFMSLTKQEGIDVTIDKKQIEVQQAQKTKELKAASEPKFFAVPTDSEQFQSVLEKGIDEIAESALKAVREHVAIYNCKDVNHITHESWLEVGTAFGEADNCPYCGQLLQDRTLVEAYKKFFSEDYKRLSENVRKASQILTKYTNKEFRNTVSELFTQNQHTFKYWKEVAQLEIPDISSLSEIIQQMENAAMQMEVLFQKKQENLTDPLPFEQFSEVIKTWENGRIKIQRINEKITNYLDKIKTLKDGLDPSQLPKIEEEIKRLQLTKRRFDEDIVEAVNRLKESNKRKEEIRNQKEKLRESLTKHGRSITSSLGTTINAYLKRLNAGFRIDYKEPNYRGKEPAASYQILINDVAVSPNTSPDAVDQPSFRNTLSAGDKQVLALALFLARINADPHLSETIVVLDDPFTSLDNFRRQFTAIEIKKLCGQAKQTIVLSHEKGFLRLLWDKIDQSIIKSISLQSGAPGITTISSFDIEAATQPRYVTERMQIEEFIEGEPYELNYIRSRLRTVCEDFYRKGDPGLFSGASSLEEIIRKLDTTADQHPYKGALQDLRDINEYSRGDSHAEVQDNSSEETSIEELKGFCQKVLDLTRGM